MKLLVQAALVAIGVLSAQSALSATISTSVDGRDNIYFTDWGSTNAGNPPSLLGSGNNPTAVSDGSGAFNFGGLGTLTGTATGSTVASGSTAYDADGSGGLYRGLPVYSLIGVWSSTAGSITAIGDSFFVGTSPTFAAPTGPSAYLFLGENDGSFGDNTGSYSVSIDYISAVPLPASLPLLAVGLAGLGLMRRRRKS